MKIELQEKIDGDETVIELGSIRLTAYLNKGKTTIVATALSGSNFIIIMPQSGNQIVLKADKTIK